MKISIAMATYNGEIFIQEQLDSIQNQTRPPDELIIVDDGSTDSTISILEKFKKKATFYCSIVKSAENRGSAFAFKSAIDLCKNDIIVFSDQDDIWQLNKLEKIERAYIKTPNIDYVISNAKIIDQNSNELGYTLWQQKKFDTYWINRFFSGDEFIVLFSKNITTGMTTSISQRIKKLGDYKPYNVIHDAWYIYAASILDFKGELIDEPLTNYRQHKNQQFGSVKRQTLNNLIHSLKANKEVINLNLKILNPLYDFACQNMEILGSQKYAFLTQKVNHFKTRKIITESNLLIRTFKILREIKLGNYRKYSSIKNIILDYLAF
jgi:glycosyltransferase involved in cell wall biosynthesis